MMGVKVVEKGDRYKVIRFSWWVSEAVIQKVLENVRKDVAVSGKNFTITRGHRLVRIEWP